MLKRFTKIACWKKIVLSFIFSFILIGCLIYWVIIPAAETMEGVKIEMGNKQLELEKNYLKGRSLKIITEDVILVEPGLEDLKKIFIKKNAALEFVTTLEKIAQQNDLDQKINLSSSEQNIQGVCKKIPLQIYTSGNFASQMKYLTALEALDYYLNIKSLEIYSGGAATREALEENNLSLQILADTYWQD